MCIDIVGEPVDRWQDLRGHNLLQMMYRDPARWSLTFQTYVQLTMLQNPKQLELRCKLLARVKL